MNQPAMSLTDILQPPVNKWLQELSRRKSSLPEGVRIVRFGDNDEDELETPKRASATKRQAKEKTVAC